MPCVTTASLRNVWEQKYFFKNSLEKSIFNSLAKWQGSYLVFSLLNSSVLYYPDDNFLHLYKTKIVLL